MCYMFDQHPMLSFLLFAFVSCETTLTIEGSEFDVTDLVSSTCVVMLFFLSLILSHSYWNTSINSSAFVFWNFRTPFTTTSCTTASQVAFEIEYSYCWPIATQSSEVQTLLSDDQGFMLNCFTTIFICLFIFIILDTGSAGNFQLNITCASSTGTATGTASFSSIYT